MLITFMVSTVASAQEKTEYKFWESNDHRCFASIWNNDLDNPKDWRDEIYRSSDCVDFWPLVHKKESPGIRNGKQVQYHELVDPYKNDELVTWYEDEGRIVLPDDKIFERVLLAPQKVTFRSLPETRVPVHVLQLADGSDFYLYVDDYKYHRPYSYYRGYNLLAGPKNNLKQIPINDVAYYFDGGTTYIFTDQGTLFIPAKGYENQPWHMFPRGEKSSVPLWNGKPLRRLDPKLFSFIERDGKKMRE